jgi:hypothetical protein
LSANALRAGGAETLVTDMTGLRPQLAIYL